MNIKNLNKIIGVNGKAIHYKIFNGNCRDNLNKSELIWIEKILH